MKNLIITLLVVIVNTIIVFAQNDVPVIDTNEDTESYFFEDKLDNDWDLYFNNEKIENDNIVISTDSMYHNPYIQLRGFIENSKGSIDWDKNSGDIRFDFNGDRYLISNSNEECNIKNVPSFFEVRYVNIKNISKDKYINKNDSITFPLYIMNNTSYLDYLDFKSISNISNSDLSSNINDKVVSIKKYNYTEEYISENIAKDMSYSQIIGILGKNDYFEAKENGCIIRYVLGDKYVEMTFSEYTDDSDMKLIKAEVKDCKSENVEKVII